MPRDPKMQDLFEASGKFTSNDKVLAFLYELMRDHLPPGTVEQIVGSAQSQPTTYTNGWLAEYAGFLTDRLR